MYSLFRYIENGMGAFVWVEENNVDSMEETCSLLPSNSYSILHLA